MNFFGMHVCWDEINAFLTMLPHFTTVYTWTLRIFL